MDNKEEFLEKILREMQDIKVMLQENRDITKIGFSEEETVQDA